MFDVHIITYWMATSSNVLDEHNLPNKWVPGKMSKDGEGGRRNTDHITHRVSIGQDTSRMWKMSVYLYLGVSMASFTYFER